jgi:hypothetical protein
VTTSQPQPPRVLGEKVWCPRCGDYLKFVRVAQAAKIMDVDRRTVYNYLKRDKVYSVKVAVVRCGSAAIVYCETM